MTLWLLLALMTAAAVAAVLWPLGRRREGDEGPLAAGEAGFYRDQIAEIERDLARGLLSPAEAEGARAEAGRRLLRASEAGSTTSGAVGEPALRRRRAVQAFAVSTVPILALALYGAQGKPNLPAQPLASREADDPARIDFAEAVARIEAHLAKNPEDGRGWEVIAPVYLRAGRREEAVRAYGAALRLNGETAERLAALAEAFIAREEGVVTREAREAFERALSLQPGFPRGRYYLALAAEQEGRVAEARAGYLALAADAPADAPYLPLLRDRLARLEGDKAPSQDSAAALPAAERLPAAAGAAAVAALPPEERMKAIEGMVEGLAGRLQASGGTAEEWQRLVRSYAVLGRHDQARQALASARAALAADPTALAALDGALPEAPASPR